MTETETEVIITVRGLSWPAMRGTLEGYEIQLLVDLERPLGERVVHDTFSEVPENE